MLKAFSNPEFKFIEFCRPFYLLPTGIPSYLSTYLRLTSYIFITVWEQYMKCDGLPDPVCVRELNTYFSLWKEDIREEIDAVLERTLEVLPIMSTLETLIENPDQWEIPNEEERQSRSYKSKVQERTKIFNDMKSLQLNKLNRATYNLLLDVTPMVDQESNVLQHFLTSELVRNR